MEVEVQGVPAQGIVDSVADITFIGGELFCSRSPKKEGLEEARPSPKDVRPQGIYS